MPRPPGTTLTEGATPFGTALVALCRERGCGFRALGADLDIPYRTLYQWIEGRTPRQGALVKLFENGPELRSVLLDCFPALAASVPKGRIYVREGHGSWKGGARRPIRSAGQSFRIRPVQARDVPEVVGLVARVLAEFGLRFGQGADTDAELYDLPESYTKRRAGAACGAFWVVEVPAGKDWPARIGANGTPAGGLAGGAARGKGGSAAIVGTAGVAPVGEGAFELRKMYLLPEARGLGAGTALLDQAVRHVRRAGGKRIVLDTVESMKGAIAFYERHGFRRDDDQERRCRQIRGKRCSRGYARELTTK